MHCNELLLFLAEQAGLSGTVKTSTLKIAHTTGVSQQTASRKLRQLATEHLIELNATPSGCEVRLTEHGVHELKAHLVKLQKLFELGKERSLLGKLKTGLGQGKYYVSRKPYLDQFKEKLGFTPYFGTLNLVVDVGELRAFIAGKEHIVVKGFSTKERDFGSIKAFKVRVSGKQNAALVFPKRSSHPENEVELIAAVNLRKKLGLKEGSLVKVSLQA